MYTIEQLQALADAGLIDHSVVNAAINAQNNAFEYRSQQIQHATEQYYADQEFNAWAATQDMLYGSNCQQYASQLDQAVHQVSIQAKKQYFHR